MENEEPSCVGKLQLHTPKLYIGQHRGVVFAGGRGCSLGLCLSWPLATRALAGLCPII